MSQKNQKIYIIAIGGAVMSSLAIALKKKGMTVSGSDDKIYDPAASLLKSHDLLPTEIGWDANRIDSSIDAVIVGMHAKADNPELLKAQELGIKIWSYPEFIRAQSDNKQRIVITGSHGKTTITGTIIHVLNYWKRDFDYVIGAKIKGIEETIKLSNAPVIIIEGDEYFTSPLDPEPKFLKYDHHIALISGTAWDHINVYPTENSYLQQFEKLADRTPKAGSLVYCIEDKQAKKIGSKERDDVRQDSYETPKYKVKDGVFVINGDTPVKLFGKHNMQNIAGAKTILKRIGITDEQFYEAVASFEGAFKRNNLLSENKSTSIYTDFAHAPSKLAATAAALKELHPKRKLVACYELHTFSSLNKEFLSNYKGTYKVPDEAIVFYDQKVVMEKNYEPIADDEIKNAFGRKDILVFTDAEKLQSHLEEKNWVDQDLLFMSSGTFGGMDLTSFARSIIS
ncbi:UDP-N-acetylmuramate: L-alanyl-gamma-D-glutamyl-meso-diaminopimelate ligase [Reichenbachiella faecimaris]|uniref:UDP-N-acetylmuramate: L-alanyl-gamma-D-glutamyl-meso-diaminopimelate ligase n=1 Tax=Reichenbachiella faecimaris TaxID=692418 RepID=A0A1W2GNL5_REIFA|nr:Mur ligase domain-containing protein [Reichenbachiella faecimaris]SMD37856.1 UDP-N-acetylmuramate: L-alanyl-gamma-D-glutamyl-meso-diaminopimelate ligase [Reichenbachiella faecimaris]